MFGLGKKNSDQKSDKKSKKQREEEERKEKEEEESEQRIQIAARFLANPNVQKATDSAKKTFLKKKGLSDSEIKKTYELYRENSEQEKQEKLEKAKEKQINNQEESDQVSENQVQQQPKKTTQETIDQMIERASTSGFLSLKKMNIIQINAKIFDMTQLKTLLLNNNPLSSIPVEIGTKQLKLILDDSNILKNIGSLVNLQIFHAIDCMLDNSKINDALWNLPELFELNISKNKISDISQISGLKKLRKLYANDNEIMEIPDSISECQTLVTINLRNNNITTIPQSICDIPKLTSFLISGNNLDKKTENILITQKLEGLKKYLQESY